MAFRNPAAVRDEFRAHQRRALIITTVVHESRAVNAHLSNGSMVIGTNATNYYIGFFSEPAGEWFVVHALTAPGNSDAGLVASKAHEEFGAFHAVMFVGVAGSLKEDIGIGSVVVGDYVYNAHSSKVGDQETFGRPHSIPAARELVEAARSLISDGDWTQLIRPPLNTHLPADYSDRCAFPPKAEIKAIASGEEVLASVNSERARWIRQHLNDAGAIEMEGWGVMNAARHENSPAIIVRGISDMCAGKDHVNDARDQPIAAAHAAAFAFSILAFRSQATIGTGTVNPAQELAEQTNSLEANRRVEIVFNFEGSKYEWDKDKVDAVLERLKQVLSDEKLTLVRIDAGSVRLVVSVEESAVSAIDLANVRAALSVAGVTLLGTIRQESLEKANQAKAALAGASADLLAWEKTLPNGQWMERAEQEEIEARFKLETSSTVLLGEPGSGKSALLSKVAFDFLQRDATVFAVKADFLSPDVKTEADLAQELNLPAPPSDLILRAAALEPVYIFIDQLDALASQVDLRSGRLNVLLNLVRRVGGVSNVHILLSARVFEFKHDVRLRAVDADAITLTLPPWHEVKERLRGEGINPDAWPQKAQDIVRTPQALKIFIDLARAGQSEPFTTYQAMLEQLWSKRIGSNVDRDGLVSLASDLAGQMAENEALWLAASRFDDRLDLLKRLEALGFVVRSENTLSVAFSHQTVFDYVLARTFVRKIGLLSNYVLERQDSLFVRAKTWSALNYLREAEVQSYRQEFLTIWNTNDLRKHIRLLLIEFLGQVAHPSDFEMTRMASILKSPDLRIFGLKAISNSTGWFEHFASSEIRQAMVGTDAETGQALRILIANWQTNSDRVVGLIKDRWLTSAEKDSYSWNAIDYCPAWTDDVESIAVTILKRSLIASWRVHHTAMTVAVKQPATAARLIRAKLDMLLAEAKSYPEPPSFPTESTESEQIAWSLRHIRVKELDDLLEDAEWSDLPSLAETSPSIFLEVLWPWYISLFSAILDRAKKDDVTYMYPKKYVLELPARSGGREKPIIVAVQTAIEELAKGSPENFSVWVEENSKYEILIVQQLIARGYQVAATKLGNQALQWLLLDTRRFQLGAADGHRYDTVNLIKATAPTWSPDECSRFEHAVRSYQPDVPGHMQTTELRKSFADQVRATKKELLSAMGIERLTPTSRELVVTEQRALGDKFDRSIGDVESGFIGSPMEAASMEKAKDREILKIFRDIPDDTNWDHPSDWARGGNVQLSRAFAEFARSSPERALRIMEQFEPTQQERAAGYALDTLAEDDKNDNRAIDALLDLYHRGFSAREFQESAARAVEKIANRNARINDNVITILVNWLLATASSEPEESEENEPVKAVAQTKADDEKGKSILWGFGYSSILPGGNFTILSALASILLNRREAGRDQYLAILNDHLSRERDPKIWRALLYRLSNAGGSTPEIVSSFVRKLFARFPEILETREAVMFLAYAQRWDDQLVLDLIDNWRVSDRNFLQKAFGELVGLVSTVKSNASWAQCRDQILAAGTIDMKVGLAHAMVNLWKEPRLRERAGDALIALIQDGDRNLVSVAMDVFRVTDELPPDEFTEELLRALARPGLDMTAAPSHFVVERLQALLPHYAELIATVAENLVSAWKGELAHAGSEVAVAAPELTDLALTLHRLDGASRQSGMRLFETMIEIDAYGVKDTILEIDGRFGLPQLDRRLRLRRSRRRMKQSSAARL